MYLARIQIAGLQKHSDMSKASMEGNIVVQPWNNWIGTLWLNNLRQSDANVLRADASVMNALCYE